MIKTASVTLVSSEVMGQAGLNTILGIGIVFIVLILISFIIGLLKYVNVFGRSKEVKVSETAAAVPETVEEEDVTDDLEIVAVIMAAIEAYEEEMGGTVPADGLVIRSIKKRNKKQWINA